MNTTGLRRELGVFGAMMMGLGSIVGTGVFVSIGLGAGIAGAWVVVAIVLAGVLATCNGLSSAQLAAAHPVSGGTYEYGYTYLNPWLGFTAGWMFLAAKSASAATAALGFAGYVLNAFEVEGGSWLVPLALGVVVLLTVLVLTGMRRTSAVNIVVVSVTLLALAAFIVGGGVNLGFSGEAGVDPTDPMEAAEPASMGFGGEGGFGWVALFHATALMFVAYTGYGRIATLGEEVREPRRTIPRAIIATLAVSAALYVGVGAVGVWTVGAVSFYAATQQDAAPLEVIAETFGAGFRGWLPWVVSVGAVTAMAGVLLNLILGLSRVALAMGRRGDLPRGLGRVYGAQTTPVPAVVLVAVIIAALASIGSVKIAWSFSAFTVLIYYGLTNAAALRLPPEQRLYPRAFAWAGLVGCLGLAWFVEWEIWAAGVGLIAAGLVWHAVARRGRTHLPFSSGSGGV